MVAGGRQLMLDFHYMGRPLRLEDGSRSDASGSSARGTALSLASPPSRPGFPASTGLPATTHGKPRPATGYAKGCVVKESILMKLAALMALGVVVLVMAPVPASATVRTAYEYYVYATGSDGIPVQGEESLVGVDHLAGDATKDGHPTVGNYGSVAYSASLATGRVQARAYSQGYVSDLWPYSFTATGRVEGISTRETLTFQVQPGYYPDGAVARLHGTFKGSVWAQVGAGAQGHGGVSLGDGSFTSPIMAVGVEDHDTVAVDTTFVVEATLVAPGTEVTSLRTITHEVWLGIWGLRIWSVYLNTEGGYVSGAASGQFYDNGQGIALSLLEVPAGVTWSSESGVFLSQVSAVPDGAPELAAAARPAMLEPCYPNPFNPRTTIPFLLAGDGRVGVTIHALDGSLVRTLVTDRLFTAGRHELDWDGRDGRGRAMPAGVYLCRLRCGEAEESRRMIIVK